MLDAVIMHQGTGKTFIKDTQIRELNPKFESITGVL